MKWVFLFFVAFGIFIIVIANSYYADIHKLMSDGKKSTGTVVKMKKYIANKMDRKKGIFTPIKYCYSPRITFRSEDGKIYDKCFDTGFEHSDDSVGFECAEKYYKIQDTILVYYDPKDPLNATIITDDLGLFGCNFIGGMLLFIFLPLFYFANKYRWGEDK